MGFLDNTSDISISAALTDFGRNLLAKGDGSFKVVKFAVADDEIDYSFYDGNHASGSAYFDLNLLLTPIFEAFSDNAASMKHKCISIPRNNLMYLPVLKLASNAADQDLSPYTDGMFYVAVDVDTENSLRGLIKPGLMFGETLSIGAKIQADQGLDTTEISYASPLDADLVESQYIVEIDNRFGKLVDITGNEARIAYVDDDDIASYYLTIIDTAFVRDIPNKKNAGASVVSGPRGTQIRFKIKSSLDLNTSDYLFDTLGSTTTSLGDSKTYKYIDAIVRVTGVTTGASIDVPARFIKLS